MIIVNPFALLSIDQTKTAGGQLNDGFGHSELGSIYGLAAGEAFKNENDAIFGLISQYIEMVQKDMKDVKSIIIQFNTVDNTIGSIFRGGIAGGIVGKPRGGSSGGGSR